MSLVFEQILVGGDRNFGYLFGDRSQKTAVLIDPSYNPQALIDRAEAQHLKITHIINTHSHHDHTNGNDVAKKITDASVACHNSSPVTHEIPLEDGQAICNLQVYHTPGHCEDHITLYSPKYSIAFTGDHLFVGKIGGTGTENASKQQWDALQRLLNELPEHTTIWPGHNYGCRPSSTLALEKTTNPFLTVKSFDEFLQRKRDWATFKKERGLL